MTEERTAVFSLATAAIALAPYTGVFLPFQLGLGVQFLLVVVVLGLLGWSARGRIRTALDSLPCPLRLGLGLYSAAAMWGAAVGLLAGNPLRYVTSQTAALILLPAGTAVFIGHRRFRGDALAHGFLIVATVALSIHGVALLFPGIGPGDDLDGLRFAFRNDAGVTGLAPLLTLVLLSRWMGVRSRWSLLGFAAGVILVAGGMARGGWIALTVGSAVAVALMARHRWRTGLAFGFAAIALLGALWTAAVWAQRGETVLLHTDFAGARGHDAPRLGSRDKEPGGLRLKTTEDRAAFASVADALLLTFPAVELRVSYLGPKDRIMMFVLELRDAKGERLSSRMLHLVGKGSWEDLRHVIGIPQGVRSGHAFLWAARGQGKWVVREVMISSIPTPTMAFLRRLHSRAVELVRLVSSPADDATLEYRLAEWRAVLAKWRQAAPLRMLAGHGLGATFEFPNPEWDDDGRRLTLPTASYIHNFYVFLGFKLGIAGAAALAGLLFFVAWTGHQAFAARGDPDRQWLFAGAAAAWLAYLVWSVSSPEIYDFRVAPLWGALVAACCNASDLENRRSPRLRDEQGRTRSNGTGATPPTAPRCQEQSHPSIAVVACQPPPPSASP